MLRLDRQTVGHTLFAIGFAAVVALAVMAAVGCSTVHQAPVAAESAGFYVPPKQVQGGYIVDEDFRTRYNALVAIYGRKKLENGAPVFVPELVKDVGIRPLTPGHYFMSNEAMENMVLLNDFKRRGSAP